MSVFVDLVALYEGAGFVVQSSLSPAHFPGFSLAEMPFTSIHGDNGKLCVGGGISLSEITFLEALCERLRPRRVFIIGNAFGWSTLALGFINRDARVVAIDYCPRPEEQRGIEVTNMLARLAGLNAVAVKGKSPQDVSTICQREFDGPVELAFIDGGHTNAQQSLDFAACRAVAGRETVYVMHDVVNFGMVESFAEIARNNSDLMGSILFRTPSGMGVFFPAGRAEIFAPVVNAFTETPERVQALRTEGRRRLTQEGGA